MSHEQTAERLILESRFEEVARAEEAILAAVRQRDYDDTSVFAIKLALEEGVTNAIKHGNNLNPRKRVTLDYAVTDDEVRIEITDEGPGFQPDDVPDCTAEENLERPSGRGIMLMKAYMTDVKFDQGGNRVTMIKKRDCPLPE